MYVIHKVQVAGGVSSSGPAADMLGQHAAGPAPATGSPGKIHSAHHIHLVLDKGLLNGRSPK